MQMERARAKINLTLHVGRVIADQADAFYGYHPLDSLVVFSDAGDELSCALADTTSLTISGPFAAGLSADENNLVLKAYRAVARHTPCPNLAFHLEKNLPVAAGIGGGSANAAATLRLMKAHVNLPDADWRDIALKIGADVPVCLGSRTAHMTGVGESVTPFSGLGQIEAVLVNAGVPVMTGDIFKAFDGQAPKDTPRPQKPDGDLLSRALDGRNDLEAAAMASVPEISACLRALAREPGCQLARMSGSGATCFGVFETREQALKAARAIGKQQPSWWVNAVLLGDEK